MILDEQSDRKTQARGTAEPSKAKMPALDTETQAEIEQAIPCRVNSKRDGCDQVATWSMRWTCGCRTEPGRTFSCTPHMARALVGDAFCHRALHSVIIVGDPERI